MRWRSPMGGFVVVLWNGIMNCPRSARPFACPWPKPLFAPGIRLQLDDRALDQGDDTTAIEHAWVGTGLTPTILLIIYPDVGLAYANSFRRDFVARRPAPRERALGGESAFSVPCYSSHTAALVRLGRRMKQSLMAKLLLELQPRLTVATSVSGNIPTRA